MTVPFLKWMRGPFALPGARRKSSCVRPGLGPSGKGAQHLHAGAFRGGPRHQGRGRRGFGPIERMPWPARSSIRAAARRTTRWQLRGAAEMVNQRLAALGLEKHPDKTFIGRIERGFDFLGYRFRLAGLTLAKQTIANLIEKASRLYEQKKAPRGFSRDCA